MLPSLKYSSLVLFIFSLAMGIIYSARAETGKPSFQESLSWARNQAAKIKDQIAGVDTSFSKNPIILLQEKETRQAVQEEGKDQEGSPACRPLAGNLSPCGKKARQGGKEETKSDVKDAIQSVSQSPSQGKVLIFISLSMPETSLKSLAQEAERTEAGGAVHTGAAHAGPVHAVLVLRGLVKDSFKETALALQKLGLSAEINPEAFDRYRINQVPTFVWVDDNDQEQARLKGNVTLGFAQQKFRDVL